jgi:GNAT superfamily N-acetyltransferase
MSETVDAPAVTYRRETLAEVMVSIIPLLSRHWSEVAKNRDTIPLNPDYQAYEAIEKAGRLRVYTVRERENLIGYAIYITSPRHLHYKARWAVSDIFWLSPDHRGQGTGTALFRNIEWWLKAEGINVMHTTVKTDHPEAGAMLEALDHRQIEAGYSKLLNAPGKDG